MSTNTELTPKSWTVTIPPVRRYFSFQPDVCPVFRCVCLRPAAVRGFVSQVLKTVSKVR